MATKRRSDWKQVAILIGGIALALTAWYLFAWAAAHLSANAASFGIILFALAPVTYIVILVETMHFYRRRQIALRGVANAKGR